MCLIRRAGTSDSVAQLQAAGDQTLFNGKPQATAFSLHNHQPLPRGTVEFGLPLNDLTPASRWSRSRKQKRWA
jgi:hypothetical protein